MKIVVRVKNPPMVPARLELVSKTVKKVGRRRLYNLSRRVVSIMKKYPPKRPKQKYVRTFLFKRSWKIKQTKSGGGYMIENTAKRNKVHYPPYVVGNWKGGKENRKGLKQAWMHTGRWRLLRDVVDEQVESVPDEIRKELKVGERNK